MKDLATLKERSIKIEEGMEVYWPQYDQSGKLDMSRTVKVFKGKRVFAAKNNVAVAFIDRDGSFYVAPYNTTALEILHNNGFAGKDFYIPFSHGELPKGGNRDKWLALKAAAKLAS